MPPGCWKVKPQLLKKKRRQIFKSDGASKLSVNFIYPLPIRSREMRRSSRLYLVLQKLEKVGEKVLKAFKFSVA